MKVRLKRLGILLIMVLSIFVCALTSTATDLLKEDSTPQETNPVEQNTMQLSSKLDLIPSPMLKAATPLLISETVPSSTEEVETVPTTEAPVETSEVTEPEETHVEIVEEEQEEVPVETEVPEEPKWDGPVLNARIGTIKGPSGKETYYDLPMQGVINIMEDLGYVGDEWYFWIREDGVKMYGEYIMCAASLDIRPKGTIIETSLGTAIVCDTGGFAKHNKYQLDIATDWTNRDGR